MIRVSFSRVVRVVSGVRGGKWVGDGLSDALAKVHDGVELPVFRMVRVDYERPPRSLERSGRMATTTAVDEISFEDHQNIMMPERGRMSAHLSMRFRNRCNASNLLCPLLGA
jgi:hypothetical protein